MQRRAIVWQNILSFLRFSLAKVGKLGIIRIGENKMRVLYVEDEKFLAEAVKHNLEKQDYKTTKGELIVYIKAFDDMFSDNVIKRTSYTFDEIVFDAKFSPMFYGNNNNTIINIDNLNKYELL